MLITDFEEGGPAIVAALANWCIGQEFYSAQGSESVVRLSQWFRAHCSVRPSNSGDIKWQSLEALRTAIRWQGPNVSQDDLDAAIAALPSTIVGQQAQIQALGTGWGS